ncbi:MAG TPA: TatD family deoxyribonuclease [Leucothrix mucor]|nr:TatD family deoxyribonuclease [Leucothrix mucor]
MSLKLVDSHCHIDLTPFDSDRDAVLQRAKKAMVSHIITPAVTASRWDNLKALAEKYRCILPAYGLHPMFMPEHTNQHLDDLEQFLQVEKAISVGECGLDFFIKTEQSDDAKKAQLNLFTSQLSIAQQFKLPVIIHARKSLDLVLKEIRQKRELSGVVHSFSGSEQQAHQLIDQGFYLGFGGPITYTRANKLRRLASSLPLDALLLETDAPDQPDASHHGLRNEPAWINHIAQTVADLRGISYEEVVETTSRNAFKLFQIKSYKENSIE